MDRTRQETVAADSTQDFIREMLAEPDSGEVFTAAYVKASVLTSETDALLEARRSAGLTQENVANLLGTRQSAIARWEADTSGGMTLGRFVDFAMACGKVPLVLMASVERVRDYVKTFPDAPVTAEAFLAWSSRSVPKISPAGNFIASAGNSGAGGVGSLGISNTSNSFTAQDGQNAVQAAEAVIRASTSIASVPANQPLIKRSPAGSAAV